MNLNACLYIGGITSCVNSTGQNSHGVALSMRWSRFLPLIARVHEGATAYLTWLRESEPTASLSSAKKTLPDGSAEASRSCAMMVVDMSETRSRNPFFHRYRPPDSGSASGARKSLLKANGMIRSIIDKHHACTSLLAPHFELEVSCVHVECVR